MDCENLKGTSTIIGIVIRTSRYFRGNPSIVFIIVFELLLGVVIAELWRGNDQAANQVGVYALIVAFIGVGLQTVASIRRNSETAARNHVKGGQACYSVNDQGAD